MVESKLPSSLSILIGSFNTHKRYPPADLNLSSWLIRHPITPHIIAIGLQELPSGFFFLKKKSQDKWIALIEKTLPNYKLLSYIRLNGTLLFIYIHSSYFNQCSAIGTARVRTGFMNLSGNKGAVGIRFEFNQTSLCFINCHLSYGEDSKAFHSRNKQYSLIHQSMLFKSQCNQYQWNINDHNGIFFFGDLNYRQTVTNQDELIEKTNILKTYSESRIKFPPTYKFKANSNSYDLSRRPSWTDRILYRAKQCYIESINYWTTSMIKFSDHRPIANLFLLQSKLPSSSSILIGSFNTHKRYPPADLNLSSWLIHQSITPHIIAIGLQELPSSFFFLKKKSQDQWIELIEKTLPNYKLLSYIRLNGTLLFIYIHSSYFNQCSAIGTARVRTGFMNLFGNKGAVGIRFEFNQTSLCFINCHLSQGENSHGFHLRNKQYSLIHQSMLFKSQCNQYQRNINDHNGIFFFGDLNYRQTETNQDELKEKTNILKTYSESDIKFPPTYKYKLNSNSYDLSRRSSWTDRILYRTKQCYIESINYWTTSMIKFSDHRPIANLFLLLRLIR
ncbi:unnamed protein product [Rotaria sordida]|uniref:Inositol polyphosphate-related phosphatase domain-containing protein n=1 Tax=Rotaria sordida TaxID=392033 RepID=A0A819BUH5_9BILA|nr:unnamed protein product [Rotaria sordida]